MVCSSASGNAWWASAPLVAVAVDKRDRIMSTEWPTMDAKLKLVDATSSNEGTLIWGELGKK
jgi:hypothetical protein